MHHLARFVGEMTQQLDLPATVGDYRGSGGVSPQACFGYSGPWLRQGCVLSHKPEHATYDSVAFRFITANGHSNHDTTRDDDSRVLSQSDFRLF